MAAGAGVSVEESGGVGGALGRLPDGDLGRVDDPGVPHEDVDRGRVEEELVEGLGGPPDVEHDELTVAGNETMGHDAYLLPTVRWVPDRGDETSGRPAARPGAVTTAVAR
ncbi:hypothetical protein FRAAL5530 [Frankia alni ACN14a]|uniref:Uncharacterized protein n=1 Tax=Frankia alni (strain DSM 45986 / CECT 9034 / ACN14a) TaxID=326424 RepID=Q0REE7_FRAAA|nr:hypothetical protein FRAAL5530 [Frankia alni ACN14a]